MNDLLKQGVSLSLLGKGVAAAVGIVFIYATFRVLEQTLSRRLAAPMRAIRFASSSSTPDTFQFSFSSPSSLKIAWAASALPSVSPARVWR
jgi:hypothetical protein